MFLQFWSFAGFGIKLVETSICRQGTEHAACVAEDGLDVSGRWALDKDG